MTKSKMNATLFLRLPPGLLKTIDRPVDQYRAAHPGRNVSRASVVRELLFSAIAQEATA